MSDEKCPILCKNCGHKFEEGDKYHSTVAGALCIECSNSAFMGEGAEWPGCEWPGCEKSAFVDSGNFKGLVCSRHFKITNGTEKISMDWEQITALVHWYQKRLTKK